MSEATIITDTQESEVETKPETTESDISKLPEGANIVNFVVGTGGSDFFRLTSAKESISIKDCIEALCTIKINMIASFIKKDDPKGSAFNCSVIQNMEKETIEHGIAAIMLKQVELGNFSQEDSDTIMYAIKNTVPAKQE